MIGQYKRTYSAWEPIDDNAKKIFKRYKVGDIADHEHTIKRNSAFHRKYFAVLNLTFQNQDFAKDFDIFREVVTIEAGLFNWVRLIDGEEQKRANSISFAKMDDLQFSYLYSKVFDVCLAILGLKSEELELELLKFE